MWTIVSLCWLPATEMICAAKQWQINDQHLRRCVFVSCISILCWWLLNLILCSNCKSSIQYIGYIWKHTCVVFWQPVWCGIDHLFDENLPLIKLEMDTKMTFLSLDHSSYLHDKLANSTGNENIKIWNFWGPRVKFIYIFYFHAQSKHLIGGLWLLFFVWSRKKNFRLNNQNYVKINNNKNGGGGSHQTGPMIFI